MKKNSDESTLINFTYIKDQRGSLTKYLIFSLVKFVLSIILMLMVSTIIIFILFDS